MTSDREQYLLDRNLRLEHALLIAAGEDIAPLRPPLERRGVAHAVSLSPAIRAWVARRIYHIATPDEIAQMRELRARGLSYSAIARRVPFCATTVRVHTLDVLQEQEVGS